MKFNEDNNVIPIKTFLHIIPWNPLYGFATHQDEKNSLFLGFSMIKNNISLTLNLELSTENIS